MRSISLSAAVSLAAMVTAASAAEVTPLTVPDLPLKSVTYPNGKVMDLTVGFGSGAFHRASDPADVFYTITDRGPNIDCGEDAEKLIGLGKDDLCAGDGKAKIFPVPDFTPTIYEMKIGEGGKVSVVSTTPLKGTDGHRLNGLSNPLTKTTSEGAYSAEGKPVKPSPDGFDAEGVVRLADGTYWIGEEYGASIAHVAADGTVIERLVPKGLEGDYKSASFPVKGVLPPLVMKRHLNRGIESIGVSPDGSMLYFALQSPLDNPDSKAYKASRLIRLFKFDPKTEAVVGEYAYELDEPSSFKADNAKKVPAQSAVKVSEMAAIGPDQLLILERVSKTTKLYRVDLSKAATIPATFDDPATSPSLEQLRGEAIEAAKVQPLKKTLVLDSDDLKDMPAKIEGIAVMNPTTLILTTDNDFGIAGDPSYIVKITLDKPLTATH
ncbi:esterase-like activity of phytase family protein [Jiella sp. MQZ9-1]|uniref:Esterase-like activity of phytase family protein n=1 Tax=Jiella flava TaxID=2816857 RepID=A0A939G0F0_9HYPH|nr:esterase-like activity of phytase family protein [Jiella flava]MBO0664194.1 esterase-like activity of phytase family protein [Jiella flava]MCD2472841.1 esterase-like activity of phytase family protein [Jiella flava]